MIRTASGRSSRVTRERIRQIESKAIEKIRKKEFIHANSVSSDCID